MKKKSIWPLSQDMREDLFSTTPRLASVFSTIAREGKPINPLLEYDNYIKDDYKASVGEWEDWAERIVQSFRAELSAANNDHKRTKALEAINAELVDQYHVEMAAHHATQKELDIIEAAANMAYDAIGDMTLNEADKPLSNERTFKLIQAGQALHEALEKARTQ